RRCATGRDQGAAPGRADREQTTANWQQGEGVRVRWEVQINARYIGVMRSRAPDLLPLFRSRHQADLLAWLSLHPDREYTATDLANRFGTALTTVLREAHR